MSHDTNRSELDVLRSLLGPDGPELSCEECFAELDRYVELELGETDADAAVPGMRAHLEGCGACDEDHQSLLTLTQANTVAPERQIDA